MGKFIGRADVRWLRHEGEDRKIKTLSDFTYEDNDGNLWTVPAKTVCDGASIPKIFWTFFGSPFVGDYREASIVHDYLCDVKLVSSKKAHELWCEMLKTAGIGWWKRTTMCKMVKWFGPKFKAQGSK